MSIFGALDLITSLLESDPNWEHKQGRVYVTKRFVVSAALLSCAVVLSGVAAIPFLYSSFAPVPFEYRELPFRVCSPSSTTAGCVELAPDDEFHAGDVVPFIVSRCTNEPFSRTGQLLPYLVSRNVVNADSGTRVILPSLATEIPANGCDTTLTFAHQLPDAIAPGRYYLEGVATVYGRYRVVNAYFYTQPFTVTKKEAPDASQ